MIWSVNLNFNMRQIKLYDHFITDTDSDTAIRGRDRLKTKITANYKSILEAANVAKNLSNMLVDVVSREGTAKQAIIEGFRVAGKTGTTQKIIDGKYSNRHHVASFAGYFPAEKPSIMITIVVDEPTMKDGRLGYGGSVAGPSFQNIGKQIISYLGLKPVELKKPNPIVKPSLASRLNTVRAI